MEPPGGWALWLGAAASAAVHAAVTRCYGGWLAPLRRRRWRADAQRMRGRVCIVTGGSRGVGRGIAIGLGEMGATVYVTGRTLHDGDHRLGTSVSSAAAAVTAAGGEGVAVQCDHKDDAAVRRLFDRVYRERGRLDVLVNNAFQIPPQFEADFTARGAPFWETKAANWDAVMDVGCRSHFVAACEHAARAAAAPPPAPALVVNVSSFGGRQYAMYVAYGVGKAAVDRMTGDMAHELRRRRVPLSVVSLWPGIVRIERMVERKEVFTRKYGFDALAALGETGQYSGRAIAELALDPGHAARVSGRVVTTEQLALRYGVRDVDGRQPAFGPPPPGLRALTYPRFLCAVAAAWLRARLGRQR